MDKLVVTQGVRFDKPPETASQGIPAAATKPDKLSTGKLEAHGFQLPTNTAGLAKFKGQKRRTTTQRTTQPTPSPAPPVSTKPLDDPIVTVPTTTVISSRQSTQSTPAGPAQLIILPSPAQPTIFPGPIQPVILPGPAQPTTVSWPIILQGPIQQSALSVGTTQGIPLQLSDTPQMSASIPYTTLRYRKRKLDDEKLGKYRRKYTRHKEITCKQCGQEGKPPGHIQYFSNWFCAATSSISIEEWKANLASKGYGKKNKK